MRKKEKDLEIEKEIEKEKERKRERDRLLQVCSSENAILVFYRQAMRSLGNVHGLWLFNNQMSTKSFLRLGGDCRSK